MDCASADLISRKFPKRPEMHWFWAPPPPHLPAPAFVAANGAWWWLEGAPRFETRISCALRMGDACLIEVSLELPPSADVQGNAMRPAGQHLGVTQFQGDYI